IDYLEYYARGALALEQRADLLQVSGERNSMSYAPRGVCAVIAPWNFPLAIPTGMLSAAPVTGTCGVLKPAEQAPACGSMAVPAIVRSAFAYAGQKCSAAARVMVHEAIAEQLQERLAGAVAALQIGQPDVFGVEVGPLIDREAQQRVEGYLDIACAEGEIVAWRAEGLPTQGWFCP